jgi:hypothetical protein
MQRLAGRNQKETGFQARAIRVQAERRTDFAVPKPSLPFSVLAGAVVTAAVVAGIREKEGFELQIILGTLAAAAVVVSVVVVAEAGRKEEAGREEDAVVASVEGSTTPVAPLNTIPEPGLLVNKWLPITDSVKLLFLSKIITEDNSAYFDDAKQICLQVKKINELKEKYPTMQPKLSIDTTKSFAKQLLENAAKIEMLKGETAKINTGLKDLFINGVDENKRVMFERLLFALCAFYRDTGTGDFSIIKNDNDDTYTVRGIRTTDITFVVKNYDGGDCYLGEVNNGVYHGVGAITLASVGTYEWQWQDGKPHGTGTQTYASGEKYEGEWQEGKRHGQGTNFFPDGRVYDGQWEDNKMHGHGVKTFANGGKYEGQWEDDKKHGTGTYTFADGTGYVGQWEDDKKHGKGTYTFDDGSVYNGQWRGGKCHGTGTYTFADGSKYEGQWHEGEMHGTGTETYPSGGKYEGNWEDDKKHGTGKVTFSDGRGYDGQWQRGVPHGQGKMTGADSSTY